MITTGGHRTGKFLETLASSVTPLPTKKMVVGVASCVCYHDDRDFQKQILKQELQGTSDGKWQDNTPRLSADSADLEIDESQVRYGSGVTPKFLTFSLAFFTVTDHCHAFWICVKKCLGAQKNDAPIQTVIMYTRTHTKLLW